MRSTKCYFFKKPFLFKMLKVLLVVVVLLKMETCVETVRSRFLTFCYKNDTNYALCRYLESRVTDIIFHTPKIKLLFLRGGPIYEWCGSGIFDAKHVVNIRPRRVPRVEQSFE